MWAHCASLATLLDNVLIWKDVNRSPHKLWHGEDPPWMDNLKPFGTIAIFKHNQKVQSKLKDRGYPAIYISPAADHSAEVHEFWNTKTKRRCQARNAVFLKQTYSEYYKLPVTEIANLLASSRSSRDLSTVVTESDYVPHADDDDSFENIDNVDDYHDANTSDDDDSEHHLPLSLVNAQQFMMAIQNIVWRPEQVRIRQTGGKLCAQNSEIWKARKFVKSVQRRKYQAVAK
jgi:hypothetical protein